MNISAARRTRSLIPQQRAEVGRSWFAYGLRSEKTIMARKNFLFLGLENTIHVSSREVTGVVVAVIQSPTPANRVKIVWQGKESVAWNEGVRQNELRTAERQIFREEIILVTFESKVLNPGTYTFPFRWQLPMSLPGSYEESEVNSSWVIPENGIVPRSINKDNSFSRYTATVFVEADDKPVLETQSVLKVIESFNPKLIVQPPKEVSGSKTFLFGGNGALEAKLSIANGGVLFSGQKLIMNLDVHNNTTRTVDKVILWLNVFTTFQTENAEVLTRRDQVFVAEVPASSVPGGCVWNKDLAVEVPATTPGSIRRGKFIQRHYELSCDITVTMGTNLTLRAPILLLEWCPLLSNLVPPVVSVDVSSSSSSHPQPAVAPSPSNPEDVDEELSIPEGDGIRQVSLS